MIDASNITCHTRIARALGISLMPRVGSMLGVPMFHCQASSQIVPSDRSVEGFIINIIMRRMGAESGSKWLKRGLSWLRFFQLPD